MLDHHIRSFIGYSNNIITRLTGSSGGIGTEIFQFLLNENLVDGVIGVGFDVSRPTVPIYKYVDKASDVNTLTGSKYVFMGYKELIEIIEHHSDKKLAIIAQPCFTKALRKKYKHIQYIISFFCGYNINYQATEYLIEKTNIQNSQIQNISYRFGNYPGGFTIFTKNGQIKSFGKQFYELIDLLFLRKGCHACGHYISADSDIVLGDAWIKNFKNATLILINTEKGDSLIEKMFIEKKITLSFISSENIYKMHKHNIIYKQFGHTKTMQFIVRIFNNRIAQKYAPFYLLGFISKIRRIFTIGIKVKFDPITEYKK